MAPPELLVANLCPRTAVVWWLLRDDHIVRMAFEQAGVSDSDKRCRILKLFKDRWRRNIPCRNANRPSFEPPFR